MSVSTHTSSWRLLVSFAPLLGAAFVFMGVVQGDSGVALSRNVHLVLVPVSLVGWWVAWSLMRVLSDTPVTPIAQARAGYVALRGKAQSIPGQPSLTTPSGTPCVWYRRSSQSGSNRPGSYSASDSVQPFLLVDYSGQCIVLPDGADISGGHDGDAPGASERLIRAGDKIYVAGEFRPHSADTSLQVQAVEPETRHVSVTLSFDDAADMRAVEQRGRQLLDEARAAKVASAATLPVLPVVCAPKYRSPFVITANAEAKNEGSTYRLLAAANFVVLLGSGGMLSYLICAGR